MRVNEIGALPDALARQPHCLVVIVADKLGVGSGAAIKAASGHARRSATKRGSIWRLSTIAASKVNTVAVSQNRAALDVRLTTEDVSEFDRWFLPRPSKRPLLVV